MAISAPSLDAAFVAIVGRERLRSTRVACEAYAVDGAVPRWVVVPTTLEQVSAVMALAAAEGLAVTPRGSGSALALGAPPARLDLALDLSALDRVLEYSPDDLTVTVESGVRLGHLNTSVLGGHRQRLPLDPVGGAPRTIGGIAVTNAWGPLRARYGTMRDLVLGLRFVQSDGVVTWGGARVVKSVTGYDVPKLLIGSLGTLGIVTELTLRLHPQPELERTWLARFASTGALQACLETLIDSSLEASRVELLDEGALGALGLGRSQVALAVAIASVEDAVREQGERLGQLTGRAGGETTELPGDFWPAMETALRPAEDTTVLQVAALPSAVATVLEALAQHAPETDPGVPVTTGCAVLGLLRVALPETRPPDVVALVQTLRELVAPLGGSVVLERAPLAVRRLVDPWGSVDPAVLGLMRAVKDTFDPRRILNPGRFVGGL